MMRHFFLASIASVWLISPIMAQSRHDPDVVRQERQESLRMTLTTDTLAVVRRLRISCAGGNEPSAIARVREAGFYMAPDAAERCTAALTRLGREGVLGYVEDAAHGATPAVRFDAGFVTAYRRREAAPNNLPTMLALKPLAERCLAGTETDAEHCYSAGYVLGLRAAHGELPVAQ